MPSTGSRANQALFVSAATPGLVNDATAQNPPGSVLTVFDIQNYNPGDHSRTYRYVQLAAGATAAIGAAVCWSNFITNVVTTVGTATAANRNAIAGVLQTAACTAGNFTWILTNGPGVALATAATATVVGAQILASAATDARLDTSAIGTAAITGPYGIWTSLKAAVVNGAAALPTDVAACYLDIRPSFDY